jgi:hypothetical protein
MQARHLEYEVKQQKKNIKNKEAVEEALLN